MTGYLIALAAGVVGALAFFLWSRRQGKKAAQAAAIKSRLDAMKEQKEVRDEVESLPDADRLTELRRWVRKPPG